MPMRTREDQNKYQREWLAKRRAEFFKNKVCAHCGSIDKLELDHIDPKSKDPRLVKHHTNSIWHWSETNRLSELAKCQVLCHPCHRLKTREDFGWHIKHGTLTGYTSYKCRCSACREANKLRSRKLRMEVRKAGVLIGLENRDESKGS